ncbi:MAG: transcription-repair coupling factor [Planctomycetota bacterium]
MPEPASKTMTQAEPSVLRPLASTRAFADLARALGDGTRCVASGSVGSSTALLAGALATRLDRPILLLVGHLDESEHAEDELTGAGIPVTRLPALQEFTSGEGGGFEPLAGRIEAVRAAGAGELDRSGVIVAPIQALMRTVPPTDGLDAFARRFAPGDRIDPAGLMQWLVEAGYRRVDSIEEPGDFAVRGGILDVFPPGGLDPVRLDFFGDELDTLAAVDLDTMGSDRKLDSVELITAKEELARPRDAWPCFLDLLPERAVAIVAETMELTEQGRGFYERCTAAEGLLGPPAVLERLTRFHAAAEINQFSAGAAHADARIELPVSPLPPFNKDAAEAVGELGELSRSRRVLVTCTNEAERARLRELLTEFAPQDAPRIESAVAFVHRGFCVGELREPEDEVPEPWALLPYDELLGRFHTRRRATRFTTGRAMDTFLEVRPGDYVVHRDHGIALFQGLTRMRQERLRAARRDTATGKPPTDDNSGEPEEFLTLEFASSSKLHVPVAQIDLVQRYVGGHKGKPPLSTIGGKRWQTQKDRVAESVRDLAAEMLRVRAAREHMPGVRYADDTKWQGEFEAEFPYQETEDQLAALGEIKRDMTSARPMDRLLCGDVGFGKTELAIRAAFKACEFGKQVAVLVPTTVLAEQHERTFSARFADYPFRVESLSRFKTTKEVNATLAALRKGQVDVIIGTHRLLSKDVRFADLGLVVVDEEQRFGVEHKERLLKLRMTVDVLTLSATPIPRTLHMAMLGLRDISSLTTPPADRRAVVTEVIPRNTRRIAQAIRREMSREGQIFFLHNRVKSIDRIRAELSELVPEARIVVGHGQMPPSELEKVMLTFMRREADVLLSTTIIESGIDIPTANTMLIDDADRFGLAELHQLRGRVGRYKHRAYCYLLLPADRSVKEVAQKRLRALEEHATLGAGFRIAMRDLEIRGAGNLLGAEQSGHIAAVGYELYCRLLEDEVRHLKNERVAQPPSATTVDLGITGVIPSAYIPSEPRRLEAYRRIATAATQQELDKAEADLTDAYGGPPSATVRLIRIARIRVAAAGLGVKSITVRTPDVVFTTGDGEPVAGALSEAKGTVRVVKEADGATVYWRPPGRTLEPASLLTVLQHRLKAMPSAATT